MQRTSALTVIVMALSSFLSTRELISQPGYPHHPQCGDVHASSPSTSCWSYATSRAFGRSWNDPRCPASTFNGVNTIDTEFFQKEQFSYATVQAGDIIGWGDFNLHPNHVCYVTAASAQYPTAIEVAQVENRNSTAEQVGLTLDNVINGTGGAQRRGNPTMIFRKRPRWSIKLENSFGGGTVGIGSPPKEHPSGTTVSELHWESKVTGVAVMDGKEYGGYVRRFARWTSSYSEYTTVSASLQVRERSPGNGTLFTAGFYKDFNVKLQNSFLGTSQGGSVKVGQTTYPAPHNTIINEEFPNVTAEAIYHVYNRIEYIFSRWDDNSTANPRTFSISDHDTVTAIFAARPQPPANVRAGGSVGAYVRVTWEMHPHASVTHYQIWRNVKFQNGQQDPPALLATVPRTTTQFTDYDYVVTNGYTDAVVWYDVRSFFSLNSTYSNPQWVAVYADWNPAAETADGQTLQVQSLAPKEWKLGSSPNPFNPSTQISFTLPENGTVLLVIYDVQGREISTLVNASYGPGYYTTLWDGHNSLGMRVSSGVYFARLQVTSAEGKVLFANTTKLLLAK